MFSDHKPQFECDAVGAEISQPAVSPWTQQDFSSQPEVCEFMFAQIQSVCVFVCVSQGVCGFIEDVCEWSVIQEDDQTSQLMTSRVISFISQQLWGVKVEEVLPWSCSHSQMFSAPETLWDSLNISYHTLPPPSLALLGCFFFIFLLDRDGEVFPALPRGCCAVPRGGSAVPGEESVELRGGGGAAARPVRLLLLGWRSFMSRSLRPLLCSGQVSKKFLYLIKNCWCFLFSVT